MTDLAENNSNSVSKKKTHSFATDGKLIVSIPEISTSQKHTVYYINVSYEQTAWTVFRRYSQFDELHGTIIKFDSSLNTICPLPTKTYLSPNPKGESFLNRRREGLEKYLHTLIKIPNVLELDDLQSFLGINKNLNVARSSSKSMEEFKWVRRTGGLPLRGRSILQSPVYSNNGINKSENSFGCNLL